jgi:AP-2 complex subunit alpha
LTLLRLYRKYPEILPPDTWSAKVIGLLDETNIGVLTSVSSLIIGLVGNNPKEYEACVPKAIKVLTNVSDLTEKS